MAAGAANHHEDVEQLPQRFLEFRQAHAVRSRLPEELWTGCCEAGAAGRDHGDGEALGLDRPSLQKWTDRLEPRPSIKARNAAAAAEFDCAGTKWQHFARAIRECGRLYRIREGPPLSTSQNFFIIRS